jgi:glucosamine--fructose-6-phosphate aminotransferase (isomerizing)
MHKDPAMTSLYLQEILEQPLALRRAVECYPDQVDLLSSIPNLITKGKITHIILTGMGASLFSCYPLWLSLSRKGIPATIWDTSELINYGEGILTPHALVIVVSQSGESAEIRRLTEIDKPIALMVGITNQASSTLGKRADVVLDIRAGAEATVSTKTYLSSLAILHLLGEQITAGNLLGEKNEILSIANGMNAFLQALQEKVGEAINFLDCPDQLAVLGRGFSMATVQTASLILKEASKVFSFGLSAAQFRHGPRELMQPDFRTIIFGGSRATIHLNEQLALELAAHSSRVVFITPKPWDSSSPNILNLIIPDVSERLLPVNEILPVQLMTIPLASAIGHQAGVFSHSGKVTLSE